MTTTAADAPLRLLAVNDRALYNRRYRGPLLDALAAEIGPVDSRGFLDGPGAFLGLCVRLLAARDDLVLSSNMKANLLTLALSRAPMVVIVNGMGRLRFRKGFRRLLLWLLGRRPAAWLLVQSYADFRFLRRFARPPRLQWVPGSGGRAKRVGARPDPLLVQRDGKIGLVAEDVRRLFASGAVGPPLVVTGCRDEERLRRLLPGIPLQATGYVAAEDILAGGGVFLQPSGYGEGFPHTLADAIASGMEILISDREFLRYGLHRLGAGRSPVSAGWSRLTYGAALQQATGAEAINRQVVAACRAAMAEG